MNGGMMFQGCIKQWKMLISLPVVDLDEPGQGELVHRVNIL
jgi:hypothetical protein